MGRGPGSTRHGEGQGTWCRLCFGLSTDLQESRVPETQGKFWCKDDLPSGAEDGVGEPLNRLDTHRFTGPGGMYPGVLRELIDVIVRPLLITFERSWWSGRIPEDWKKADITTCLQGETGELQPGQPHCNYWEDEAKNQSQKQFPNIVRRRRWRGIVSINLWRRNYVHSAW